MALGKQSEAVKALLAQGRILVEAGELSKAQKVFREACQRAQAHGNAALLYEASFGYAEVMDFIGRELTEQGDARAGMAWSDAVLYYNRVAGMASNNCEYEFAVTTLKRVLEIDRTRQNSAGEAQTLLYIGQVLNDALDRQDEARPYLKAAIPLLRDEQPELARLAELLLQGGHVTGIE
jgi:tetratricopeptide (TPR) repeat protein